MAGSTTKSRQRYDNGIESLREGVGSEMKNLGTSALDQFFRDFLKGSAENLPRQVLNGSRGKDAEKQMVEGEEMLLKKEENVMLAQRKVEMHRDYFRENFVSREVQATREEEQISAQRVDQIQSEIQKLITASQEMEQAFKQVNAQISTRTPIKKPSNYEVNFFEWVLLTIKNARARIEEGKSWLAMFTSRKAGRQYWNMAKKHGTTFTLSSERTASTQTG